MPLDKYKEGDLPLRASLNVKLNEEENRQDWTVFLHTVLWDMTTCKYA